jgi:hypothetical protein
MAVLIVAYRRSDNVRKIIEMCLESGITSIYITIDYPRENSIDVLSDHDRIKNVITESRAKYQTQIKIYSRIASVNQGSAVSVVSGCDWALSNENELVIIEDDCLPNRAFFEFCKLNIRYLDYFENVLLICGTQFAPKPVVGNEAVLSKYPLTWGWGTTKTSWSILRKCFFRDYSSALIAELRSPLPEIAFWRAGSRRAIGGFTDVWDTVLVESMLRNKYLAILPPNNLVTNNGNDLVATHIAQNSPLTNLPVYSEFGNFNLLPVINKEVEDWIRNNCYKIGKRHFFTTKITILRDHLSTKSRRFPLSLGERLSNKSFSPW